MDFLVTHDAPYAVRIKGVAYNVPRFLTPALKTWAAEQRKQIEDNATAELLPEHKARLLLMFQHPPIDIRRQLQLAVTAEGAEYVARRQLKIAGVPDDVIQEIIDHDDPLLLRNLAEELTMLPATAAAVDAIAGIENAGGDNPLTPSPPASGGAPSTGENSTPDSTPPTPDLTPKS